MPHTPGPWVCCDVSPTHGWAIAQEGSKAVGGSSPDDTGGVVGTSEWMWLSEDDARLIAAAPDLLAACKRMLACLESLNGHDWAISADTDDAMVAATEAITKVEPKQITPNV